MAKSTFPGFALLALAALLTAPASGQSSDPSRPAENGCAWEKLSDAKVGLGAWVQRCDFGDRKIDLHFQGNAVVQKFSDGGDPEPVIRVFALKPAESDEDGMRRIFDENTAPDIAARCVAEDADYAKPPADVWRYTFVPNAEYAAELARSASPDEVPEPPCGPFGIWPDGIQYFEIQGNARTILFVVAGQDAPLFDEQTLELLGR